MAAYFFFNVKTITNQELVGEYRSQVMTTVEAFGGRYLIMGGNVDAREGDWQPSIPVLIRFPNTEKAKAWYESSLYAPLKDMRMQATECDAVLLEGFDHP